MVFVTVVMACWVNAQSAILRLFLAMRMFRVLTARPKPFSNCCWNPTKTEDCTEGLNKFAAEVEEVRGLLTGTLRSSMVRVVVMRGSKFRIGLFAVEPPNTAPGVVPPKPPAVALRIPVSARRQPE